MALKGIDEMDCWRNQIFLYKQEKGIKPIKIYFIVKYGLQK